ncbi:MAG TPA: cytochrome C [Aromatoleum sp.]|uniref:cytochrome C n=1 Tax=Aromatoleum sp. TaxID=2307007 RepID=UPI002B48558F|nr:cytochrome C [Aromatoleum sp.]HJV26016.1 cytochrome C [Aromatoleum sp.]
MLSPTASPESSIRAWRRIGILSVAAVALLLALVPVAHAVPAFARQTGQACSACHIGAFGPQLTPYGIRFKLGGYALTDGQDGKLPLAAMALGGFTHTAKKQDEPPADHTHRNNNLTLDEAAIFLAGRLADHLGTFVEATYDGVEQRSALDHADLRFTHDAELAGKNAILGITVNNNPGVQDPFNTLPVWSFPFAASAVGFGTGDAATLINGGLEHRVIGASGYAFWNDTLYAELGTYRALSRTAQSRIGLDREDIGRLGGDTSYWRVAWMQGMEQQSFSAGVFGFRTSIQPDHESSGPTNKFNDIGVDAAYQFLGTRKHIGTFYTSYIHERQTRDALLASSEAEHRKGSLDELRLNASYYYDQTWGATVARFLSHGSRDATLYGDGFAHGLPNTAGYVVQADWTPWGKEGSWKAPWANLRLGVQYTLYDKFNGARHNFDSNGRDARDNNTLFVFAWTAF